MHLSCASSNIIVVIYIFVSQELHRELLRQPLKARNLSGDAFKFLFVRHPIGRLVSAYTNKYLDHKEEGFVKDLEKFSRSRGVAEADLLNFKHFVDFVLQESRQGKISYGSLHWMPYTNLCEICDTHYDMIGKLETFDADVAYLGELFPHMGRFFAESTKRNAAKGPSKATEKFLDELTADQRQGLCDIYEWDLRMFNYTCY